MIDFILSIIYYFRSDSFQSLLAVLKVIFIFLSVVFAALIIYFRWKAGYFSDKTMMYKWRLEKPPQKKEGPEE